MAGALSGCASSQKSEAPAAAPAASPETMATGAPGSAQESPQTLAEAEALLERARGDFERLALNEPAIPPPASAVGGVAPAPAPAPAAPKAAPRAETRAADKTETEAAPANSNQASTCETACKAFSSLSRASDAVCRLDATSGKRCERARQIQQDASRRVASCGCAQ